jgi:Carboxypeptidase regulatory-like domain
MRIAISILTVALLLAAPAFAQSADTQSLRPQIEGTVVSALNGQLVPRAVVVARNAKTHGETTITRADDNAHFVFERLAPSSYQLFAGKQGYFSDSRKASMQPIVELAAGAEIKDVIVRLMPLGVISGRIVDEGNDPVRGVEVRLLSLDYYRGRQTLSTSSSAVTDDRGEYRIFDIRPGSYYLLAEFNVNKDLNKALAIVPPKGSALDLAYPPLFYPATSDMPQAQKIAINAGDELHADFALVPMQAVSIQGRVVNGLTNRPVSKPMVTAYWGENTAVMARTAEITEQENGFEIRGLGPGTYTLRTNFTDDGENFSDERVVEVTSQGLRNLVIAGLPDFEVWGHVRLENARLPAWNPSVEFASVGPRVGSIFRVGTNRPDMQFTGKLHPGDHYKVNVPNLPQDFYLKSVRVSGREVPNTDVVIGGRRTELDLIVSPAGGHIEGSALNDRKEPVSGSYLLLVPDFSDKINADLIRTLRCDFKGKFVMRGVPPGNYKLFAFEDIEVNEILNQPELLKNYESNAQAVRVEESGKYTLEVKPVPAPGGA